MDELPVPHDRYRQIELSPEAGEFAVSIMDGHSSSVHTYEFRQEVFTRQTSEGDTNHPVWSPDGSRLGYASNRAGQSNVYVQPIGGGGPLERLTDSPRSVQQPWSWSSDGDLLAYAQWDDQRKNYDLWLVPAEGDDREPTPFVNTPFNETQVQFSPTHRLVAYVSQEEGRPEVFVQQVSTGLEPGLRRKASRNGGWEPKWASDGRELFYRSLEGSSVLGVQVDPDTIVIGPEQLVLSDMGFPTPDDWGEARVYDVAPDGRFLALLADVRPERAALVVVQNWTQELQRLVPTP